MKRVSERVVFMYISHENSQECYIGATVLKYAVLTGQIGVFEGAFERLNTRIGQFIPEILKFGVKMSWINFHWPSVLSVSLENVC